VEAAAITNHGESAVPPSHSAALLKITDLISADRAPLDLRRYLRGPGGSQLERLADYGAPDEFTANDFRAVQMLSVRALHKARQWLRGDGRAQVRCLLQAIPSTLDIWNVEPEDYSAVLGPGSPAWRLWILLYDKQAGARRAGRAVTAGKLLHAKRPRLIPIFDRGRVAKVLNPPRSQFWEVMWYALRDPGIRHKLQDLQSSVSESAGLSLLRVLDIVVWMSVEPAGPGAWSTPLVTT
jgi:hypothetical protein